MRIRCGPVVTATHAHGWGSPPSCAASNMISKTAAAKPKAPPSRNNRNNEDGREEGTRGFRDAADSHRDHLGSETHVRRSVGGSGLCLSLCLSGCQTEGDGMLWNGMGWARCTSERHSWCAAPPPPCEIAAKQIGQTGKGGGRWSRRSAAQSSEGPHGQQLMHPNRIL